MHDGHLILLKEGELITGRKELSKATGIPETTIERILKMLESEHQIGQQKTNKYRVITILNWKEHQERTPEWTTGGQLADTYKNDKKEKEEIPAPEDGKLNELSKLFQPTFNSGEEEGVKKPKQKRTPAYAVLGLWNKYPNWKATGRKETPKNPSVLKELLPVAPEMETVLGAIVRRNQKYSLDDFERAIKAYATHLANLPKDTKGYYLHRFTLYEFLTHANIFERYVTR